MGFQCYPNFVQPEPFGVTEQEFNNAIVWTYNGPNNGQGPTYALGYGFSWVLAVYAYTLVNTVQFGYISNIFIQAAWYDPNAQVPNSLDTDCLKPRTLNLIPGSTTQQGNRFCDNWPAHVTVEPA
jgi:hypothetical protein